MWLSKTAAAADVKRVVNAVKVRDERGTTTGATKHTTANESRAAATAATADERRCAAAAGDGE